MLAMPIVKREVYAVPEKTDEPARKKLLQSEKIVSLLRSTSTTMASSSVNRQLFDVIQVLKVFIIKIRHKINHPEDKICYLF